MKEFSGTKGKLELKYAGDICIGIGTIGAYSQMTANTILPDTDEEYEKEKEEIEANMTLYTAAPDLLEALQEVITPLTNKQFSGYISKKSIDKAIAAINKALGEGIEP